MLYIDLSSICVGGEKFVIKGYNSLRAISAEAGLKCPERITSTKLRKYMATVSQVNNIYNVQIKA